MKWRFTQCWWIPRKVVLRDDWTPMHGSYRYEPRVAGNFIEDVPEGGDVTELKVRRGSHDKEWCAEGILELDDRIDEEVAYELAWEAVVQRAYTTVPDLMDGSEFEWGEVEKEKPRPRAAWGIPRRRNAKVKVRQVPLDPAKGFTVSDAGDGPFVRLSVDHPDTGHEFSLEVGPEARVPDYRVGLLEPFIAVAGEEIVLVYERDGQRFAWVENKEMTGSEFGPFPPSVKDPEAAGIAVEHYRYELAQAAPKSSWRKRNEELKRRLMR